MKKNKYLYIMILLVVGLLTIFASSYAFFSINASDTVGNYEVVFGDNSKFKVLGTQSDNLTVSDFAMYGAGTNQVVATFSHNLTISLENFEDSETVSCTYDYIWRWDNSKDSYKKSVGATLEYAVSGPFGEKNVPDYDAESFVLGSGRINLPAGEQKVTNQINITSTFYNLADIDQSFHAGKTYKGGVIIDNINCNNNALPTTAQEGTLAYHINSVYNSQENINNIKAEAAGLYYHNEALTNGANDKTIRYTGKYSYPHASEGYNSYNSIIVAGDWDYEICQGYCSTLAYDETNTKYTEEAAVAKAINDGYLVEEVNNYVCFQGTTCTDDNLYRIISVNSETNQTKVIKAVGINSKWNEVPADYDHTTVINNWEGSTIETYLNGTYLNSLPLKNKIVDTLWNVGELGNQLLSSTPKSIYDTEKGTETYKAKVGLMYVSEYGFAALPKYWTYVLGNDNTKGYNLSKGEDWMITSLDNSSWTISRSSQNYEDAIVVVFTGNGHSFDGAINNSSVGSEFTAHPSFVLSSEVMITNADSPNVGSKTNPMIIN